MKADQDDAPEYLRSKKKEGPGRFLAILCVESVIFRTLATLFAKPIVLDNQIKQGIHVLGKTEQVRPYSSREPLLPTRKSGPHRNRDERTKHPAH